MPHPETPRNREQGHEMTVWRSRPFFVTVACFFAFLTVLLIVVAMLTKAWTHQNWPPRNAVASPVSTPGWNTNAPQLQVDASKDLRTLREQSQRRLHAVQWTDGSHTYATIPIERAMPLLEEAQKANQLDSLLPKPKLATPLELQNQKSEAASPPKP